VVLYKYVNKYGVDILRSLRLRVTPPLELNDPFELAPRYADELSRSGAQRILQIPGFLRLVYDKLQHLGVCRESFEEFTRSAQQEGAIQKLVYWYEKEIPSSWLHHKEAINKRFGVLCFAEEVDNILMWSHYGDSHKGIVVGLDTAQAPFQHDRLFKVVYSAERVLFDISWGLGSPEHLEFTKALIRTKSPDWAYENEWRLMFSLDAAEVEQTESTTRYFFKIPPAAVAKVILGSCCGDETEQAVRAALADSDLNHVLLERVCMHNKEFRLTTEPVQR